jgi:hypothetical protein
VEAIGEKRDEIVEHVASAGEAVQQQRFRGALRTGLAIEDLEAIGVSSLVLDARHETSPSTDFVTC